MAQKLTIRGMLRLTRFADGVSAIACLIAAILYLSHSEFNTASILVGGAIFSAACYHWQPAKLLASKLLFIKG